MCADTLFSWFPSRLPKKNATTINTPAMAAIKIPYSMAVAPSSSLTSVGQSPFRLTVWNAFFMTNQNRANGDVVSNGLSTLGWGPNVSPAGLHENTSDSPVPAGERGTGGEDVVDDCRRRQLMWADTLLSAFPIRLLKKNATRMSTPAIAAASKPYSMAEAPSSSFTSLIRFLSMCDLLP